MNLVRHMDSKCKELWVSGSHVVCGFWVEVLTLLTDPVRPQSKFVSELASQCVLIRWPSYLIPVCLTPSSGHMTAHLVFLRINPCPGPGTLIDPMTRAIFDYY